MTDKSIKHLEFGQRLSGLMDEKGLKIGDVQRATGINYEMIRRYREGIAKPRDDGMQKLADCLEVSTSFLAFGEASAGVESSNAELSNKAIAVWHDDDTIPDGMIAIGYLHDICGSLGNGYLNEEPTDELQLWFREETLRECNVNPTSAKAFVVRGDSMAPDITDGQTIAVDTSATRIFDGEIYAFRKSGELKVKYLFKHGDGFKAVSRNDDKVRYPDEIYTAKDIEADNIEIIGQFWWKSETKRVRR
ncbi:LexA family transcriptional regulator [Moraxella pluranimalium]|uniref:HTH cro/C1-type domain-containing protein n=1 Tax=Moraxella pluranimalium TaxID=470453 RepID=A0A1T0CPK6_9GAMM|nr:XRE family transcriptional regulator [Moraxella pluranimalium]OOS24244.1 hypothetical protein B0680_05555 [Moraxella pluranimalium]